MTDDNIQKQTQHFEALKSKYQVSHYEESSPYSPLYFILQKVDVGIELLEFELDWLKAQELDQIIKSQPQRTQFKKAQRTQQLITLATEFYHLKSKYQATNYYSCLGWTQNPLCFILHKLDSRQPLNDSEMKWLTEHDFVETIAHVYPQEKSHFAALKTKYQATQHQNSSPSSPLYPILTRLDAKTRLSNEEINWLKSHELVETLSIFQQQESAKEAKFAKLKAKYQATKHSDSYVSSPLYQILQHLDASQPLNVSERHWLKEQELGETFDMAQEIEQKQHFAELKKKYKATQYEDSSPSSHLYPVLKRLEAGNQLSESELNFLKKRKLTDTIAFAVLSTAASLKSTAKSGNPLSQAETDGQKQKGRENPTITVAPKKHFATLKSKYGVSDYQDNSPSSQLYAILQKLDNGERLEPTDVAWLIEEHLFYSESKIFTTYHKNDAIFYEQAYKRTGNKWNLPSASSHWRKAEKSTHALTLTDNLNFDTIKEDKLKSALLTTRGGAFRDISDLDEAEQCARRAIKYQPSSHHPYTLMGAICYEWGEYSEGDIWFNKAIKRGASPRDQDAEIKRVIKNADKDKRREVAEYLLKKDPLRYKWAKKYLVDKR